MSLASKYSSIVAGWSFDSSLTAADIGSQTLTNNNGVTSTTGKFSNAASFASASSQNLSIASNSTVQTGDTTYMLRGWVKLSSKSSRMVLIGKDKQTSGDREYTLWYSASLDRFRWSVFSATDAETIVTADNFGSPSTGVWYLIHCWYDATANQSGIAVNAGTENVDTIGPLQAAGAANLRLGARDYSGFEDYYDGLLDDVLLMKTTYLDATERTADYNGGTGVKFADWAGGGSAGLIVPGIFHKQSVRRSNYY